MICRPTSVVFSYLISYNCGSTISPNPIDVKHLNFFLLSKVAIHEGHVSLWINFIRDKRQGIHLRNKNVKTLNDGAWHSVKVKRNRMETALIVDEIEIRQVGFQWRCRVCKSYRSRLIKKSRFSTLQVGFQ